MADTGDLSRGAFIRYNNELMQVLEYEHRTPGNLRAFFQVKMRNVKSGKLAENRFRAGEAIEFVRVDTANFQILYKDGENLVCMDQETFDQIYVPENLFGNSAQFLKDGMEVIVSFDDTTPILAQPPHSVELLITYSEPAVKGDTSNKVMKSATLETGAEIMVPIFVNEGEKIRINTETGEYMERVK